MVERSLDGNHFGLVLVELRTWPLRIRFFPNKSSRRLVEGFEWLQKFCRRTTTSDLPELHGDFGTPWTVPGKARDLSITEVEAYAGFVEPPINLVRCPPGTRSLNMPSADRSGLCSSRTPTCI